MVDRELLEDWKFEEESLDSSDELDSDDDVDSESLLLLLLLFTSSSSGYFLLLLGIVGVGCVLCGVGKWIGGSN